MAFKVKIKNIGKLADAEIHIGGFIVFAGPRLSAISRSLSTAAIFPRIGLGIGQASSMRYFLLPPLAVAGVFHFQDRLSAIPQLGHAVGRFFQACDYVGYFPRYCHSVKILSVFTSGVALIR